MAPRIRGVANVSNLTARCGSKRSMASISPSTPELTRSPGSTVFGSPAPTRPATNLTNGAYETIKWSRADALRRLSHRSHCIARYGSTSTMLMPGPPPRTTRRLVALEPLGQERQDRNDASLARTLARSCAGVGVRVGRPEPLTADVRVPLRGRHVGVPEELLHGAEVRAPVEQVG